MSLSIVSWWHRILDQNQPSRISWWLRVDMVLAYTPRVPGERDGAVSIRCASFMSNPPCVVCDGLPSPGRIQPALGKLTALTRLSLDHNELSGECRKKSLSVIPTAVDTTSFSEMAAFYRVVFLPVYLEVAQARCFATTGSLVWHEMHFGAMHVSAL